MVAETLTGAPAASLRTRWDSSRRGPNLGRLATNCTAMFPISNPVGADDPGGLGQQGHARGPGVLGPVGAEMRAEIPDPAGREERVGGGVGHGVAVGVAGQSPLAVPEQAAEPQRLRLVLGGVGMDIHADPGPRNDGADAGLLRPVFRTCSSFHPACAQGALEEPLGEDQVQRAW